MRGPFPDNDRYKTAGSDHGISSGHGKNVIGIFCPKTIYVFIHVYSVYIIYTHIYIYTYIYMHVDTQNESNYVMCFVHIMRIPPHSWQADEREHEDPSWKFALFSEPKIW